MICRRTQGVARAFFIPHTNRQRRRIATCLSGLTVRTNMTERMKCQRTVKFVIKICVCDASYRLCEPERWWMNDIIFSQNFNSKFGMWVIHVRYSFLLSRNMLGLGWMAVIELYPLPTYGHIYPFIHQRHWYFFVKFFLYSCNFSSCIADI